MPDTKKIINQIKEIRAVNNELWIQILQLAFEHAPKEAKEVFKRITACDKQINKLSEELGE